MFSIFSAGFSNSSSPCSTSLSSWQYSLTTTSWSSPSGLLWPEPPPAPWASAPPCSPSHPQLLHPWPPKIPAQGLQGRAIATAGGWSLEFLLWGLGCGWGYLGNGFPCRTPDPGCTANHLQLTYHLQTGGGSEYGSCWRWCCEWGCSAVMKG